MATRSTKLAPEVRARPVRMVFEHRAEHASEWAVKQTAQMFALDLPHSDACFVRAYPAATAAPFEACDQATGRVSSQALVRYKTNDFSVPVAFGHRDVRADRAAARRACA